MAKLRAMSYDAFLRDYAKVDPQVNIYFMQNPHDLWAMGIDGVPAANNLTQVMRDGMGFSERRPRRTAGGSTGWMPLPGGPSLTSSTSRMETHRLRACWFVR